MNVLSLDAGGTKGLFYLLFLEKMFKEKLPNQQPSSVFQLCVGSSIGAIVSALVACGKLDGPSGFHEVRSYLFGNIASFFGPKNARAPHLAPFYNGRGKQKALERLFGKTKMKDVTVPLCIVCCGLGGELRTFCSFRKKDHEVLVWKALDASSAAPVVFPPAVVVNQEFYFDGGVLYPNPVLIAYACARYIKSSQSEGDTGGEADRPLFSAETFAPNQARFNILSIGQQSGRTTVVRDSSVLSEMGIMMLYHLGNVPHLFSKNVFVHDLFVRGLLADSGRLVRIDTGLEYPTDTFDDAFVRHVHTLVEAKFQNHAGELELLLSRASEALSSRAPETRSSHFPSKFRVLSVDSIGPAALSSVLFLRSWVRSLRQQNSGLLSNQFDYFVGSGIGAVLAALVALGRLDKLDDYNDEEMDRLNSLLRTIAPAVPTDRIPLLRPYFAGRAKSEALRELFGDTRFSKLGSKKLSVVCSDLGGALRVFSSFCEADQNVPIRDALDASTATLLLFPPVAVFQDGAYVDGTGMVPDPVVLAFMYAYQLSQDKLQKCLPTEFLFGKPGNIRVVSIGRRHTDQQWFAKQPEFLQEFGLLVLFHTGAINCLGPGNNKVQHNLIRGLLQKPDHLTRIQLPDELDADGQLWKKYKNQINNTLDKQTQPQPSN